MANWQNKMIGGVAVKKVFLALITVMFLTFTLSPIAFAEEGDFYEKHKSEFDKNPFLGKSYLKTIKKYDSETNTFECGGIDIGCKMTAFELGWGTGLAKFASKATESLIMKPETITKEKGFLKYKNWLSELSSGMLVLFIIWQMMVMMMRRFGDPDDYSSAMNQKLLQVFAGGILLGLYEPLINLILTIQHEATQSVLTSGVSEDQLLLQVMMYTPQYSIFFGIAMSLIYIVFIVAIIYRFVAFGFFYAVGPIAIPTIVNEEFNYFSLWLKYIVNNVVTLFLQSLAFALAVTAMTGQFSFTQNFPYGVDVIAGFILGLVICFFALVVPGILGNMGSSTGTGRMMSRVVRYAVMRR